MHITFLALGSRGDVQPFIPLGKELQRRGDTVRIATFKAYRLMIEQAGLEFFELPGDAHALLQMAMEGTGNKRIGFFEMLRALRRSYGTLAYDLPGNLSKLGETDLILNQLPSHLFAGDLAEAQGIPWAVVTVIPLMRSRHRALLGMPRWPGFIPGYNLFTYRAAEQMGWQLFRNSVNRLRIEHLHLKPHPFSGFYETMWKQQTPILCGFSEQVVTRLPDWGSQIHLTGWWLPEEPDWIPPDSLAKFVDAGPPPVFIGFGSMLVPDSKKATAMLVEAVRLSGQRAILHTGWAGLGGELPGYIYPLTYAPYDWLFPRTSMVVHHGGSGTTGFGFHSGVPSLICPFVFDQYEWGARAFEMGVGPRPIPFRKLTLEKLASAIRQGVEDTHMRANAQALGVKLRGEQGLQRAVEIIHK